MVFHKLTIQELTRQTKDAVSITFSIPDNLLDEYKFKAGQYITVEASINGANVRRAYSISSSSNLHHKITIVVKAIKNGMFSNFANTELKKGDQIKVSTIQGNFTLSENTNNKKRILLIAAGSGITPIKGMIHEILENRQEDITLLYGNQSLENTIFKNELEALCTNHPSRLKIHYALSQEETKNHYHGRISTAFIKEIFTEDALHEFENTYICGPQKMIENISEQFRSYGIDDKYIKYELFVSKPTEDTKAESQIHNYSLNVIIDDENFKLEIDKPYKNLLEAILANNIDVPYSCQGGVCSSCMCKVTDGSARMSSDDALSKDEIEEGIILSCIAQTDSKEITIDFDQV